MRFFGSNFKKDSFLAREVSSHFRSHRMISLSKKLPFKQPFSRFSVGLMFTCSIMGLANCSKGKKSRQVPVGSPTVPSPVDPVPPTQKPQDKVTTFQVATYNVENMWDGDLTNSEGGYAEFAAITSNWGPEVASRKAKRVAKAIEWAGAPDIVGMQEFEFGGLLPMEGSSLSSCPSLDLVLKEVRSLGYTHAVCGEQNPGTPITQVLISKFPILSSKPVRVACDPAQTVLDEKGTPVPSCDAKSNRHILAVDINVQENHAPLRVYVAHLKSQRASESCSAACVKAMQKASFDAIQEDINGLRGQGAQASMPLIIGDLNSDLTALASDIQLNYSVSEWQKGSSNDSLFDLWMELPESSRCSVSYNQKRTCIDHILLPKAWSQTAPYQYVPGSFRVVGHGTGPESNLIQFNGFPFRGQVALQKDPELFTHKEEGYSDHLPLVAQFKTHFSSDVLLPNQGDLASDANKNLSGVKPSLPAPCVDSETLELSEVFLGKWGTCVKISGVSKLNVDKKNYFLNSNVAPQWEGRVSRVNLLPQPTQTIPDLKLFSEEDWKKVQSLPQPGVVCVSGIRGRLLMDRGELAIYADAQVGVVSDCAP